jgi:2-methylfumaryl-CoA isomerase
MHNLLAGLTIVEASSFVASPSAGLYLAQMGAEVIRVDQQGGGPDFNRWPLAANGKSLYWENLNRGKKSVALDLASAEGRATLQELAAKVGILLTNFPVEGFLSHEILAAKRPDLITVRIMGTASGGPALDYTVNAAIGLPFLTGPAEMGEAPVNHVLPAWDLLTGAYAAFALLAALRHRDATGEGQEVRIPLQDVATGTVAHLGMIAEALVGTPRPRLGNDVYGAFGRDFVTADGVRVMIMAITPRQWTGLVKVLGIESEIAAIEAAHNVSFARDEGLRYDHRAELYPLVEAKVRTWHWADLDAAFAAAACCYGRYRSIGDAARDPELVTANPLFGKSSNPSGETYPAAGPFAASAEGHRRVKPAPHLGADTGAVLAQWLGEAE